MEVEEFVNDAGRNVLVRARFGAGHQRGQVYCGAAQPVPIVKNSQPIKRDQRKLPFAGASDKSRLPNIRKNRFARCKELTCFRDAARSESVKGNAS